MNWNDLAVALILVGLFTFALIRDRLARADAEPTPPRAVTVVGTVDGIPRWYAGTVRVDSDRDGRMLGYLLEVMPEADVPRPAVAYKLVVAGKGHASRLGGLEGKTIHIFGSVGERGDGLYLFVEDFTEKEKEP